MDVCDAWLDKTGQFEDSEYPLIGSGLKMLYHNAKMIEIAGYIYIYIYIYIYGKIFFFPGVKCSPNFDLLQTSLHEVCDGS